MKKALTLLAAATFGFGCISCDDGASLADFCKDVVQCSTLFSNSTECENTIQNEANAAPDCSELISKFWSCRGNAECNKTNETCASEYTAVIECKIEHNY